MQAPRSFAALYAWLGKVGTPQPAAPFPLDLVLACAALVALAGDLRSGIALLLSYDAWLRISEVSGLTVDAVVDHRGQFDLVGRGVSVYLPDTKTGRHQVVRIEDPEVAELLLASREAVRETSGGNARLFGIPRAAPRRRRPRTL